MPRRWVLEGLLFPSQSVALQLFAGFLCVQCCVEPTCSVVKERQSPLTLSSERCSHHMNSPENEIPRVLSTTKKQRGLAWGGLGEGCNTAGTKPRATLTVVTAKLKLLWFHSPSVSVRSGSRKRSGTQADRDSSLDRDTRRLLWEESAGITQGRVSGPGLQVVLCPIGQNQLHGLVPCKGGWRRRLARCREGRTWVW